MDYLELTIVESYHEDTPVCYKPGTLVAILRSLRVADILVLMREHVIYLSSTTTTHQTARYSRVSLFDLVERI